MTVRQVQSGDLPRLLVGAGPRDRFHHVERAGMQERGEATYLVAWDGDLPCGRGTMFHRSKYERVRDLLGDFPELNGLEAVPRGRGIGTRLVAAAEARATTLGAARIGLAVEHGNVDARRLYERLGYVEWEHGDVVDRWFERDGSGTAVREHADPCSYLVKNLTGR
ncbi:Acetyltransferase (GNAT) family protein [Blastococcus aurantiacus]|uniref:Acetyltransferase (GNAT) family protein n=1 Tax=Blastococcus aurantiacus TaxID=1550231 RepID=A0A1G7LG67_9ACTN|nr:GNAT family N-acetyltransferase [Blastococcus aurantiacus]SDF48465.1 Acetyltransferase (GNAT) family protein [Blastococcus aurantiacus]